MKHNLILLCSLRGMLVAGVLVPCSEAPGQAPPPPNITSPQPPPDVEIPQDFPGNPIDFFDDFSWRIFVAMVWPALDGQRGTPDPAKTVGEPGPRVFETFKALHEVFHSDGTSPSSWNSFDLPQYNPCDIQAAFGDVTLGSFSKFSNLGQASFGSLVGPLIAQNGTYVRFLTTYNKIEFDQIVEQTLYRRPTPPPKTFQVTFKNGAIDTKSAWMDMKDAKQGTASLEISPDRIDAPFGATVVQVSPSEIHVTLVPRHSPPRDSCPGTRLHGARSFGVRRCGVHQLPTDGPALNHTDFLPAD